MKKQQPSEASAASGSGATGGDARGLDGKGARLEIKSICGYWRGGWPLGAELQIIEFTDGSRVETRDPVVAALRVDLQHHRCQVQYALGHIEGACDCESAEECSAAVYRILGGCDHYRAPQWWLDALAKDARTAAVADRGGAADAPVPPGTESSEGSITR